MIMPTLDDYTPGRTGHVYLTVLSADLATPIRARSNTGIVEVGSGSYGLPGGIAASAGYCIYDDDATQVASGWVEDPNMAATAPIVLPAGGVSPVVAQIFRIKRGDDEPLVFPITELDTSGAQVLQDVTGWTGNFKLRATPDVGSILINQPFYISDVDGNVTTDGSAGLLGYDWPNPGETDREGAFLAEFECLRSDGRKKTYPTTAIEALPGEYIQVHFIPDLDDAGSH